MATLRPGRKEKSVRSESRTGARPAAKMATSKTASASNGFITTRNPCSPWAVLTPAENHDRPAAGAQGSVPMPISPSPPPR